MGGHVKTVFDTQLMLFDRPIGCTVTRLDAGIQILLAGGDSSHIGAVSICVPGEPCRTTVLPGHKEAYISEPWAQAISDAAGLTCCVVCGIHYDNAAPEQIREILSATDDLLKQVITALN